MCTGADPGFYKKGGGGSILGLQPKKKVCVCPGGGPILGPMLKSLHSGPKSVCVCVCGGGGVRTPWTPPPDPPMVYNTYADTVVWQAVLDYSTDGDTDEGDHDEEPATSLGPVRVHVLLVDHRAVLDGREDDDKLKHTHTASSYTFHGSVM